jgi:hypothetical protein
MIQAASSGVSSAAARGSERRGGEANGGEGEKEAEGGSDFESQVAAQSTQSGRGAGTIREIVGAKDCGLSPRPGRARHRNHMCPRVNEGVSARFAVHRRCTVLGVDLHLLRSMPTRTMRPLPILPTVLPSTAHQLFV